MPVHITYMSSRPPDHSASVYICYPYGFNWPVWLLANYMGYIWLPQTIRIWEICMWPIWNSWTHLFSQLFCQLWIFGDDCQKEKKNFFYCFTLDIKYLCCTFCVDKNDSILVLVLMLYLGEILSLLVLWCTVKPLVYYMYKYMCLYLWRDLFMSGWSWRECLHC